MDKHPFIVVEGIDGSGKTTLAKLLADLISAEYIKSPVGAIRKIRAYVDSRDPLARFLYYLADNIETSLLVAETLKSKPVVCDRYILSTLLNHKAMGVDVDVASVNLLLLTQPQATVYLWAEEEEIVRRLKARSGQRYDSHFEQDRPLQKKVHNLFCGTSNITPFNTGEYNSEQMPALAAKIVRELGLNKRATEQCER